MTNNNDITKLGWSGSNTLKEHTKNTNEYIKEAYNPSTAERQKAKLRKVKEKLQKNNIGIAKNKNARPSLEEEIQGEAEVHLTEFFEALELYKTFNLTPELMKKIRGIEAQLSKLKTSYLKKFGETENQFNIFAEETN